MSASPSPWNPPQAKLGRDDPDDPLYAGFWRRFAAHWLDLIIVYILMFVVGIVLGFAGAAIGAAAGIVSPFVILATVWLYFALMHSSARQATLGKMAFGIKVTDAQGERISFLRATGRYFSTWVSSFLLAIGYLMAAFTSRKQALHDMMAGTLVVRSDAPPESVQGGGGTMRVTAGVFVVVLLLGPLPVIGIMAAVAIPAYQDYLSRSQLTESVSEARIARAAIEEHYARRQELPKSLDEAGYRPASALVSRVSATLSGPTIEVRVQPAPAVAAGRNGAVLMRSPAPPAAFEWRCLGDGIPNKYLPANCRT